MSIFQRKHLVALDDVSSHWTVETLREYLLTLIAANEAKYNERFEASQNAINAAFLAQQTAMSTALTAQKLAVDTALGAADRAVTKAEMAAEKRFESVNEFRETLTSQQATFMTRNEVTALLKSIEGRITASQEAVEYKIAGLRTAIEKNADNHVRGENELRLAVARMITQDTYETRHSELQRQVNELRESRSEQSGKSSGIGALWGFFIGAIGIIATLITLAITFFPHIIAK